MTGLASNSSRDRVYIQGLGFLDSEQTTAYTNFTPPKYYRLIKIDRDVSFDDLETMRLDMMPGYRFSWWYTSTGVEVTPEHEYADDSLTKHLVR